MSTVQAQPGVRERPIAVYGATGYTGGHVARRLIAEGATVVVVGRNAAKLERLAADLDGDVHTVRAELDDGQALRRALDGCAAVISTAGPFARYGRPVVEAAIEARVHYLDVAGEQSYIAEIFRDCGPAASRAGVALIPAVGIDSVPADMLAALAADGMGRLDAITVVIDASGGRTNVGSLLTVLDGARRRDGRVHRYGGTAPAPRRLAGGRWDLCRQRRVLLMRFDGAEIVLLPRHLRADMVDVFFTAGSQLPGWLPQRAGLMLMAGARTFARTPAYPLLRPAIARFPGPRQDIGRITVEVQVRSAAGTRRGLLSSPGGYRFTAVAAVEAAQRAADPTFTKAGPLTPAQAFDPETFLSAISADDVQWSIDRRPLPVAVFDARGWPPASTS